MTGRSTGSPDRALRDDVVGLGNLRLCGLDAHLFEDRHEGLAESQVGVVKGISDRILVEFFVLLAWLYPPRFRRGLKRTLRAGVLFQNSNEESCVVSIVMAEEAAQPFVTNHPS